MTAHASSHGVDSPHRHAERDLGQPSHGVVHSAWAPDHAHDHDDEVGPLEDNPIWQQDNVTLHSVGIDIGSSGTQALFSRLHLRRIGEDLSSRYVVIRRTTTYRSPVALTPYAPGGEYIDAEAVGGLIDRAYAEAGARPETIDTGVVILTGEALRRRNSEAIGSVLAERAGDLVTVTAGHHMEAMLAAYGSGAAQLSRDRGLRILNVDVGGGTTKLTVVADGRVEATAAVSVGGRLAAVDDAGRLVRLEPAGRRHAARLGLTWELGAAPGEEELETVAEAMADALITALLVLPPPTDVSGLFLTEPLGPLDGIDGVMFSGGVAEYVYEREDRRFGDLGAPLGRALRARVEQGILPLPLLPPGECIRATALGASEYSVQLSGNTGWISDPDALLPRRNLPVVHPAYRLGQEVDRAEVAAGVRRQLVALDAGTPGTDVALALHWTGAPSYARISAFAAGLRDGLAERIAARRPLYLMLDGDVAMTLGRLLTQELGVRSPLLAIDGLALRDFDYIDIGRVRHPSRTVPVTIKSLLFPDAREADDLRSGTGAAD